MRESSENGIEDMGVHKLWSHIHAGVTHMLGSHTHAGVTHTCWDHTHTC